MQLLLCFLFVISFRNPQMAQATDWVSSASSPTYRDTKLVTETESPFALHYFPIRGNTISNIAIVCNKFCASNASCQAFSLYPNNTQYVCEYSLENFCNHRQRVALQYWPGSTVWDKLTPSKTRGCIDEKFARKSNSSFCDIGRSGCTGTWPNCNSCNQSCANCTGSGFRNCTMWPEGHNKTPIFGFCNSKMTVFIKRQVHLSNGTVWPNYTMSFQDISRLSQRASYRSLQFRLNTTEPKKDYLVDYINFRIHPNGTLAAGLTYVTKGSSIDGFYLQGKLTRPAPFIFVQNNTNCGSFWFLNVTQTVNMTCPGGATGLFGLVDITVSPPKTGIYWRKLGGDNGVFFHVEARLNF